MAKDSKKSELAVEEKAGLAMMHDPLAGILEEGDDIATGTEEMGAGDVRIPRWAFNTKHVPKGEDTPIPPNRFLNTVSEEVRPKLRLQVITNHKSRAWTEFDESEGKRVTHCRSWDGVTGRTADGTQRPCARCPDYEWRKVDGKNTRHCGDVANLVAIDRESGELAMLSLRKTAVKPFSEYYQRVFYKKRPVPGRLASRVDLPFFALETTVTLRMERSAGMTWAVPVFDPGPTLSREEILAGHETLRAFQETHLAALEAEAERAETETGVEDASFDFGGNIIDAQPVADSAGRF